VPAGGKKIFGSVIFDSPETREDSPNWMEADFVRGKTTR
jgi:hypothetical protein